MLILDTNVISEVMRQLPSESVARWLAKQSDLFTTAITQAEVLSGIEMLPIGRRRHTLFALASGWFEEQLRGRILPFDTDAAVILPIIKAKRSSLGRPISYFDAQIAAIARAHGATLATRNTADFEQCGIELVNPWLES